VSPHLPTRRAVHGTEWSGPSRKGPCGIAPSCFLG
jgi:hypothetical protein